MLEYTFDQNKGKRGDILKILYTGFKGKNNSSFQLLNKFPVAKVYLTNSFDGLKRDIMGISEDYDLIVMFGVDTHLKGLIRIETVAEYTGIKKVSKIDCDRVCEHLKSSGIQSHVSEVPTKYLCNAAYYHMLNKTEGKAIFIHIPSVKNMSENIMEKIMVCLKNMEYYEE